MLRQLTPIVLVVALATAAAGSVVPGNMIEDGEFEEWPSDAWSVRGGCAGKLSIVAHEHPVLDHGQAVHIESGSGSCFLAQTLEEPATQRATLLEVDTRVLESPEQRPYMQPVSLISNWDAPTADKHAVVQFFEDEVRAWAYGGSSTADLAPALMPEPGEWGHFQLVLVRDLTGAVLFVDGVAQAIVDGDEVLDRPPEHLLLGDLAVYRPVGPDVEYDNVYVGPAPLDLDQQARELLEGADPVLDPTP